MIAALVLPVERHRKRIIDSLSPHSPLLISLEAPLDVLTQRVTQRDTHQKQHFFATPAALQRLHSISEPCLLDHTRVNVEENCLEEVAESVITLVTKM